MANSSQLHFLRGCFLRKARSRRHLPPILVRRNPEIITPSAVGDCRPSTSSLDDISDLRERILQLTEKPSTRTHGREVDDIRSLVSSIADELLAAGHLSNLEDEDDLTDLAAFLDSRSAVSLLRQSPSGLAFIELLCRLKTRPRLAVQVFLWRLKLADDSGVQLVPEEYAKVISLAGRSNKADLAFDLFTDAGRRGIKSTGIYNSLMASYMYSGLASKAVSVFEDLNRDAVCKPSLATYNILLSVYGRLMLIDKLEDVLQQIHDHPNLSPNLTTYNILIAAYLTAWMWDRMETTYKRMISDHVEPNAYTHCLMLRGYAHACNIEKMEEMYRLLKGVVKKSVSPLIRAMICAYCKSPCKDRVGKIEELIKHIPEGEYRPWLNVLMIRLYAQEGLLDAMERLISEAVHREVKIIALGVMRSVISSYFRCDSIDRLIKFINLAECAGWRLCRSLYHCKMVMHGQRNQMKEMHQVLKEMENVRFDLTKKTFLIMYKAYSNAGRRSEAEIVTGLMCKNGFLDAKAVMQF